MGEKYKTKDIKARLLNYYRFECGYDCGQEVDKMDIFAISRNKQDSIEIEIKISKADLQNELHKKKHKLRPKKETPNRYFICVPNVLKDDALEVITKLGRLDYGIMDCDTFEILKKAKRIDKNNDYLYEMLVRRLSSDIANKYQRLIVAEKLNKDTINAIANHYSKTIPIVPIKRFVGDLYTSMYYTIDLDTILDIQMKVNEDRVILKYKDLILNINDTHVTSNKSRSKYFYNKDNEYYALYVILSVKKLIKKEIKNVI